MSSINQKTPKFPCIDCHTDCCKEYTIFVNAHDVYRLSNGLNCKPETFLELIGAKDYSLGIKVEEGLVDLALKQKNNACKFLEKLMMFLDAQLMISNQVCANHIHLK